MKSHQPDDRSIALQAAAWLQTLKKAGPRENKAFANWLLESRRHVRTFLLITAFDKELGKLDRHHRHDVRALIEGSDSSVTLPITRDSADGVEQHSDSAWSRLRGPWMVAASVLVVALIALAPMLGVSSRDFTTAVGEQRSFKLPDGSLVHLNTRSRVVAHFSKEVREVQLIEGEALFVVAHHPSRPFRVVTGTAMIQAVGTEFNVYRLRDGTRVSVIEGKVQVSAQNAGFDQQAGTSTSAVLPRAGGTERAAAISAGEEATINLNGTVQTRTGANILTAVAWRQRRLVFQDNTLADVAEEFNRYNTTRIEVDERIGRQRTFTGVLDADKPEALWRFLTKEGDLTVDRQGDVFFIRSR